MRLVSTFAVLSGLVTLAIMAVLTAMTPTFVAAPALGAFGGFVLSYWLTRKGHDLPATWLLCWSMFLGPCCGIAINPQRMLDFQLYCLFLPAFLASVLLDMWAAVAMCAIAEVALWAAPLVVPAIGPEDVLTPLLFGLVVSPVTVLSSLMVSRDLKQLHAQALALEKARDEALAASEAKSRFLARAGHELKTPLTSALGYTDLSLEVLRSKGELEVVEDLERVRKNCTLLGALVDEILLLARLDLGKLPLKVERVDCAQVARDCVATVRPQAQKAKDELVLDVEAGDHLVTSDAQRVSQILINLLSNAVKATNGGTVTLRVAAEGQGGVRLTVEDTGVGMTADDLKHLFEEFWQNPAHASASKGVGLGLTITRQLCGRLGAQLAVHSEPGRGTTFTVRLPALMPVEPAAPAG